MKTIAEIIIARGITEIVHFTSNHGLVGCMEERAVVSRRFLPEQKHLSYVAAPTAVMRQEASSFFDKEEDWLDYINLSISEINYRYFNVASTKWHPSGRWWVILSFSPSILEHDGVYFTTTNNVYEHVVRKSGAIGLEKLFEPLVRRKGVWSAHRGARAANLPTCEQAEVLYPHRLSLDFLSKIYVINQDHYDTVCSWLAFFDLSSVEVVVNPGKFGGRPN